MLKRLSEGVPPELACTAAGIDWEAVKELPEVIQAAAEGEILLFERAATSSVTGVVRAAMRRETKTWLPTAEPTPAGLSLEDLLRE